MVKRGRPPRDKRRNSEKATWMVVGGALLAMIVILAEWS